MIEPLSVLTLENYDELFNEQDAFLPLWNSTLLGLGAATAVMLVVSAIAYFVHKMSCLLCIFVNNSDVLESIK